MANIRAAAQNHAILPVWNIACNEVAEASCTTQRFRPIFSECAGCCLEELYSAIAAVAAGIHFDWGQLRTGENPPTLHESAIKANHSGGILAAAPGAPSLHIGGMAHGMAGLWTE